MTDLVSQSDAETRLRTELDGVADRLHAEFDAALGEQIVARQLSEVLDRLHDARILTYLPVLAEREAKRALQPLRSSRS